jgi:ATP-binding cassette subfamily F protein uup
MLVEFDGMVLLVSYDRDFLDRVVTSVIHFEGDGRWLEYAGGHADMLAQRRHAEAPETGSKPGSKPKAATKAAGKPRPASAGKLTFKDQHVLKTLPGTIAELETEVAALQDRLADPDLFRRDADAFHSVSARLDAAARELAAAEEEWLRLEMLREELEGR